MFSIFNAYLFIFSFFLPGAPRTTGSFFRPLRPSSLFWSGMQCPRFFTVLWFFISDLLWTNHSIPWVTPWLEPGTRPSIEYCNLLDPVSVNSLRLVRCTRADNPLLGREMLPNWREINLTFEVLPMIIVIKILPFGPKSNNRLKRGRKSGYNYRSTTTFRVHYTAHLELLVQAACVRHPWWRTKISWPLFSHTFFFFQYFGTTRRNI